MGYTTKGSITSFWPDDTDTIVYLCGGYHSLQDIIDKCNDKWPGTPFEMLNISSEKIHTDCLGYDLYDSGDYTDFIVIEKQPE